MPESAVASCPFMILVFSVGGGTGRSEIAASLAHMLATRGEHVWLVDGNLFAPSLDLLLGCPECTADLSQFLAGGVSVIPTYDLLVDNDDGGAGGYLLLTPASRAEEARRGVEEVLVDGDLLAERLPSGILMRAAEKGVDVIIVDTVPSFAPINRVWLAMTRLLLVVSGPNAVDSELLRTIFCEESVHRVDWKLVHFNNLELDCGRRPRGAMGTIPYRQQVADFIKQYQDGMIFGPDVEIFPDPVPFSEELATYDHRGGLFVKHEPDSSFARRMARIADVVRDVMTRQGSPGH